MKKIAAALAFALFTPTAPAAVITFSGYDWTVRSGVGGPGPNNWSDQNVSVDASGHLHLNITFRSGQWTAAEITSLHSFGFGTYQFQLLGQPHQLNDNVVLGLFNYGPPTLGPDGTNEIDIEFATFGSAQANHGNWTVYPAAPGPYTTQQYDATPNSDESTHRFTWSSERVNFQALTGLTNTNAGQYATWAYAPPDYLQRIPQNEMPVHMNLWLFQGNRPTDGLDVEIIVSSFTFTPLAAVPEPSTYALMIAGLGFVGFVANRRRKARAAT